MRRRRVGWAGEGFLLLCGRVRQLPRWGAGRAIALMLSPPLPPPPVRGPACARGARRTRRPVYFFFALFFFFPPRPPSPRHTADGVGAPPVADTPLPSSRHPPPSPIPRGEGGGRTRRSSPPPPPPLMPPLLPLLSGVPLGLPRAAAAPGLPHAAVASAERAPALSRPLPWPSGLSPDDGAAALNGGAARHGVFHAGLKAEPRPHWRSGRVSRGAHRQGGHPAGWGRPLPPHAASGGCQPAPPSPPRRGSTGQGRWRQGARAHPPRRDGFPARRAGRGCRDNTHHTGRVGGAGGAAPTALVSPPYPLERSFPLSVTSGTVATSRLASPSYPSPPCRRPTPRDMSRDRSAPSVTPPGRSPNHATSVSCRTTFSRDVESGVSTSPLRA